MRLFITSVLTASALCGISCGESRRGGAPTAPTPTTSVTGTYSTSNVNFLSRGRMIWILTQSGEAVTGPVTVSTAEDILIARGTLNGTVAGSMLIYTITIPAGGVTGDPTCTARVEGQAEISPSELRGPFAGTATCAGSYNDHVVMRKET